jgi:hypothetical protein
MSQVVYCPKRGPNQEGKPSKIEGVTFKLRNWITKQATAIPPGLHQVGRDPHCGIWIDDESVSRVHANLCNGPEGVFLEDAGSTNGTWLEGKAVLKRAAVNFGQLIRFGRTAYTIEPEVVDPDRQGPPRPTVVRTPAQLQRFMTYNTAETSARATMPLPFVPAVVDGFEAYADAKLDWDESNFDRPRHEEETSESSAVGLRETRQPGLCLSTVACAGTADEELEVQGHDLATPIQKVAEIVLPATAPLPEQPSPLPAAASPVLPMDHSRLLAQPVSWGFVLWLVFGFGLGCGLLLAKLL